MDKETLDEIVRLHGLWLIGSAGGIRANLSNANLSNADLRYADLRYADLSNADLSNADLRYATGDGYRIRTIQTGVYVIVIFGDSILIGCQSHKWVEWQAFDDSRILAMDGQKALEFWRVWKPILTAITEGV